MTEDVKPKRKGRPKGSTNKTVKSVKKTELTLDDKIKEGLTFLSDAEKKRVFEQIKKIVEKKTKNILG